VTEEETFRLLKRMAEGDQAAARQFYLAYASTVKSFLKRRGEEFSLVEDALQATMMEIWKHPDRYQPGGRASFKTWLLGIANNRLIDLLRKRPDPADDLDEEMIFTEMNEGYERMHEAQRKAALQQCMQRLKGPQRQLLTLAYEHEVPGREIGEIMGMPEGTVKSTLHYAKGLIKKCLERLLMEVVK
jgi:RNA polymerase sigma-70 factor (ECF subfamily)